MKIKKKLIKVLNKIKKEKGNINVYFKQGVLTKDIKLENLNIVTNDTIKIIIGDLKYD